MSDVEQLVEVIRQMDLIVEDVRKMQETPMPARDDLFYNTISTLAAKYDELVQDRNKLVERIPNGLAFVGWLASRHLI